MFNVWGAVAKGWRDVDIDSGVWVMVSLVEGLWVLIVELVEGRDGLGDLIRAFMVVVKFLGGVGISAQEIFQLGTFFVRIGDGLIISPFYIQTPCFNTTNQNPFQVQSKKE